MFHWIAKIIISASIFLGITSPTISPTPIIDSIPTPNAIVSPRTTTTPTLKLIIKSQTPTPTPTSTPTPKTPEQENCPWYDLKCKISSEPSPSPQIIYTPTPTPTIVYQTPTSIVPLNPTPTPASIPTQTQTPTPTPTSTPLIPVMLNSVPVSLVPINTNIQFNINVPPNTLVTLNKIECVANCPTNLNITGHINYTGSGSDPINLGSGIQFDGNTPGYNWFVVSSEDSILLSASFKLTFIREDGHFITSIPEILTAN